MFLILNNALGTRIPKFGSTKYDANVAVEGKRDRDNTFSFLGAFDLVLAACTVVEGLVPWMTTALHG